MPFVHLLAGVGHISGTINESSIFTPIPTLLPENTSRSNTALVIEPGAGLDFNLREHFAVRIFQIDYVMSRFYNQRQDNGRVSAGIVFQLGRM